MRTGDMVRPGDGPPMKLVTIFEGMGRCIFVDSHGRIRQRFYYLNQLTPLWVTLQPKSLWPDPGNLPEIEDEKERRYAFISKMAARKASTKPKASNKIERKASPMITKLKGTDAIEKVLAEISAWREGKLWGKPAIAKFSGVGIDTVARWASIPSCPISRPGGTYFAVKADLAAWIKRKNAADATITNDNQRSA